MDKCQETLGINWADGMHGKMSHSATVLGAMVTLFCDKILKNSKHGNSSTTFWRTNKPSESLGLATKTAFSSSFRWNWIASNGVHPITWFRWHDTLIGIKNSYASSLVGRWLKQLFRINASNKWMTLNQTCNLSNYINLIRKERFPKFYWIIIEWHRSLTSIS